jgi:serine phosphatase RsbU (regulator of sigma subunit)
MTTLKQNNDITEGFIKFIIVQAYRDNFLSSLPRIITLAYENGILLRYAVLIFLLSIYFLFPYFFIFIGSYAIPFIDILNFKFFSYTGDSYVHRPLGLDHQSFYLLRYACCVLLFTFTVYLFPNNNKLGTAILSVLFSYTLFDNFIYFEQSGNIHSTIRIVVIIIVYYHLFKTLDTYFLPFYSMFIFHIIFFSTFKTKKIVKELNYIGRQDTEEIQETIFILSAVNGVTFGMYLSGIFSHHIFYPLVIFYTILFFLFLKKINYKDFLYSLIIIVIFFILSFSYSYYVESKRASFNTEQWSDIINIVRTSFIIFAAVITLYLVYKLPLLLFPHWWFTRKYRYLFGQDIQTISQAFTDDPIPEGRKFIPQYAISSSSPLEQKIEMLTKMEEHEKETKKPSQDVLDELAKAYQELKQEQRQAKLTGDVSPVVQDSSQITSFEFTDPAHENEHITLIERLNSARQQLLGWLKGKTPANPSIDKLLIYQWQDYEIGIGLKYSGQMGGDFYDLFQLPIANADNQVGVFISDFGLLVGDLTGHGVETALNLSKTHNFWAETDLSQDVLTTMQAFEQNFKTTFQPFPKYEGCELCYLQLKDNEITLSRAGLHLGVIRDNQWHNIAQPPHENFMALGNWQSLPVKRHTRIELKAGETLIVYTDGLFENANQDGEQFGQDNFQQLLLQHQHLDMNSLIETVFKAVYEHCQPEPIEDDETLLVIRRISSTTTSSTAD